MKDLPNVAMTRMASKQCLNGINGRFFLHRVHLVGTFGENQRWKSIIVRRSPKDREGGRGALHW